MDAFDPARVFSSIDHGGRYAYANQPAAARWNLARFAETLLPLIDADAARAVASATLVIDGFPAAFEEHWQGAMRRKLGLFTEEEGDAALVQGLLDAMQRAEADFTVTFRRLCAAAEGAGDAAVDPDWLRQWRARLARESQPGGERAALMRLANPCCIPRNHRIEAVIEAAVGRGDFAPFEELALVLARPYEDRAEFAAYAEPPLPGQRVLRTFCGT
jgi:uncharacterized protein YdiU (UPF0061 family)